MMKRLMTVAAACLPLLAAAVTLAPTAAASGTDGSPCRSGHNGGRYVPEPAAIYLDSCALHNHSDSTMIIAGISFINPNRNWINPCAQLVNVDTGKWAYDYGCTGWTNEGPQTVNKFVDANLDFTCGTYVVQVGFWAGNQYYGNVQSPRYHIC